jgi:hypothetical protein
MGRFREIGEQIFQAPRSAAASSILRMRILQENSNGQRTTEKQQGSEETQASKDERGHSSIAVLSKPKARRQYAWKEEIVRYY